MSAPGDIVDIDYDVRWQPGVVYGLLDGKKIRCQVLLLAYCEPGQSLVGVTEDCCASSSASASASSLLLLLGENPHGRSKR